MGKHFDTLIDIVKNEVGNHKAPVIGDVKTYLSQVIRGSALFEMPLNAEQIRPHTKKDEETYAKYIYDYLLLSQQYGKRLLMPFERIAIEDNVSVVFLDSLNDQGSYIVSSFSKDDNNPFSRRAAAFVGYVSVPLPLEPSLVNISKIEPLYVGEFFEGSKESAINYPNLVNMMSDLDGLLAKIYEKNLHTITPHGIYFDLKTIYQWLETGMINNLGFELSEPQKIHLKTCTNIKDVLTTHTISCIEQIIYITDPLNFIIKKEHKQSLGFEKQGKSKKPVMRRTILRPHYICVSEEDAKEVLSSNSADPRPAHPVRGHWRTLMSDRFVNKKGSSIFIKQYFTGQGLVEGLDGYTYQIMIKESPTQLVAYNNNQK